MKNQNKKVDRSNFQNQLLITEIALKTYNRQPLIYLHFPTLCLFSNSHLHCDVHGSTLFMLSCSSPMKTDFHSINLHNLFTKIFSLRFFHDISERFKISYIHFLNIKMSTYFDESQRDNFVIFMFIQKKCFLQLLSRLFVLYHIGFTRRKFSTTVNVKLTYILLFLT